MKWKLGIPDIGLLTMKSPFKKFLTLGHHINDSDEERLKKSSLLVMSGPFAVAALVWGLLYFANGLVIPASIPFSYGVLSVASIISFSFTKKYKFFRSSQLFLILILPFALQISLGGFVPSSAVIYWAIIAPAGAMFFDSIERSAYWFAAYLLLIVTAYFVNDIIPGYVDWNLTEEFINALFLMNIIGVSSIVFGILYYFVSTITSLNADIEKKNIDLKEQSEKLREMDTIKSRFFANISHEFRTPLTLILGLIKKRMDVPGSQLDPKDTDIMYRNAQQLQQLINQLLDLSKLESGELPLRTAKSNMIAFAANLIAQFESLTESKKITLTFNGNKLSARHTYPAIELYFDHEKLQKVLMNLFSNAVKFTPENGKIAVEVKNDSTKENVMIKVSNTGDGIPEDKLPYIFDRFFQVDSGSNRKYDGTGIGLALVKELVELHHGTVCSESNLGVTCFTVQLPKDEGYLKKEEKVATTGRETDVGSGMNEVGCEFTEIVNEKIESDDDERLEILIVEDNSDLRSFIKDMLQKDYHVIEAVDGQDGFDKAEAAVPDLILSDVMMPRIDGFDLCKQLKANEKTNHIPVILLTAKALLENKLEGLELGADDYLVKPFDENELKARIKNLIAIRAKLQKKFQGASWQNPATVKVASVYQKFLEDLKKVIEKNIDNELFGVDDLGKPMAMSRSQIHRKLKALIDQPATTFIRNYRLHRAADLLKQDAGNVTEIAYQVGFNSQTYFSSSFAELFGCSPSEYKNRPG